MSKKIGLLTIGQAPRVDMTPEMEILVGDSCTFVEAGALDDLTADEIKSLAPETGEATYVSRLRNGEHAKLFRPKLYPLLQEKILELEKHVSSTIIVCTGNFPYFVHSKPLLFPDKILTNTVTAVLGNGKLGVIVPLPEQQENLLEKWEGIPVLTEHGNPYVADVDLVTPARILKKQGATIIVLDCMGYTEAHKEIVKNETGLPVILPRSIVARVAAELA